MKIKKGDKLIVDKGILGRDFGTFVEVNTFHAFGCAGIYECDGEERAFDTCVHSIKLA